MAWAHATKASENPSLTEHVELEMLLKKQNWSDVETI